MFKSYAECTEAFVETIYSTSGWVMLDAAVHPTEHGPKGEILQCLYAYLGNTAYVRGALVPIDPKIIIVISGVHGVEGMVGSNAQREIARSFTDIPDGTGVLLIHLVNPYGAAHIRRTDENNVDVNRNFIDGEYPTTSPNYEMYSHLIEQSVWGTEEHETFISILTNEVGAALTGGQYISPLGYGYGGTEPSWSFQQLRYHLALFLHDANQISVTDLHTGIGEFAQMTVIVPTPEVSHHTQRIMEWMPGIKPQFKEGPFALLGGDAVTWIGKEFGANKQVTCVVLEGGTTDMGLLEAFVRKVEYNHLLNHPDQYTLGQYKKFQTDFISCYFPHDRQTQFTDAYMVALSELFRGMVQGMQKK